MSSKWYFRVLLPMRHHSIPHSGYFFFSPFSSTMMFPTTFGRWVNINIQLRDEHCRKLFIFSSHLLHFSLLSLRMYQKHIINSLHFNCSDSIVNVGPCLCTHTWKMEEDHVCLSLSFFTLVPLDKVTQQTQGPCFG